MIPTQGWRLCFFASAKKQTSAQSLEVEEMKPNKHKAIRIALILLGVIAAAFLWLISRIGIPAISEAREVEALREYVMQHNKFTERSKSAPESPPVFNRAGATGFIFKNQLPHQLIVYGITDPARQDAIISTVRQYREEHHIRPVVICFYQEENWTIKTNTQGTIVGGSRGPEKLIRRKKI
ncbi:MAG: hypothetical protein BWY82_00563 [Verrucomicrobia bacterium ADurb.Bin474]|nr:MAG: hypothetical protein BWY82_00563 [Verrucomicrobia bacterium ADurb.Bin474]